MKKELPPTLEKRLLEALLTQLGQLPKTVDEMKAIPRREGERLPLEIDPVEISAEKVEKLIGEPISMRVELLHNPKGLDDEYRACRDNPKLDRIMLHINLSGKPARERHQYGDSVGKALQDNAYPWVNVRSRLNNGPAGPLAEMLDDIAKRGGFAARRPGSEPSAYGDRVELFNTIDLPEVVLAFNFQDVPGITKGIQKRLREIEKTLKLEGQKDARRPVQFAEALSVRGDRRDSGSGGVGIPGSL